MRNIPEAAVAVCKCRNRGNLFGIRLQKANSNEWHMTWAFEMAEKAAKKEGYDATVVKGGVIALEEYPGCPYCGNKSFFICGCGKLNCLEDRIDFNTSVTCKWCGRAGTLTAYDGSGFNSGGDR